MPKHGIHIAGENVPNVARMLKTQLGPGGLLTSQQVIGAESSVMMASRDPGYHSRPHRHDCEQLNYVTEGEGWIFSGDEGFLFRQGDFFRIPRGEFHWSWNRGSEPFGLIEFHTPGLDIREEDERLYLLRDDESERYPLVVNEHLSEEEGVALMTRLEREVLGESYYDE